MNTLIVGAGRIGQAFQHMVGAHAAHVEICDSDEAKCPGQKPLSVTVPEADAIFLCIPSWTTREVLLQIKPLLKPMTVVISVAKGIEKESLKTLDEIINDTLGEHRAWGVIIGPMLAEEITQGQGAAGVLASAEPGVFDVVKPLFSPADLHLEYSPDVHGVALCGVLKNIYALGLGIGDGLGWGANRKGWLVTHAIHEMRTIISGLGGNPESADSAAGLGDLVATGFSPYSRNRGTGDQIVKTGEMNPLSEGYVSITSLAALLENDTSRFPLLTAIYEIVVSKRDALEIFSSLLAA